jgi:hypothetical protein
MFGKQTCRGYSIAYVRYMCTGQIKFEEERMIPFET